VRPWFREALIPWGCCCSVIGQFSGIGRAQAATSAGPISHTLAQQTIGMKRVEIANPFTPVHIGGFPAVRKSLDHI